MKRIKFLFGAAALIIASLASSCDGSTYEMLDFYDTVSNSIVKTTEYDNEVNPLEIAPSHAGYTFKDATWRNGTKYFFANVEYDIENNAPYRSVNKNSDTYYYYRISLNYTANVYKITYTDVDDVTTDKTTWLSSYTVDRSSQSLPKPSKPNHVFEGWYDEYNNPITSLPLSEPRNLTLHPTWSIQNHNITYRDTNGLTNPNPTTFNYTQTTIALLPLVSDGRYEFVKWVDEGGETITTIDTSTTSNVTIHAITVPVKHVAKFYDKDHKLVYEIQYDVTNFRSFSYPNVPIVEHYTGSWEGTLKEDSDSEFVAKYEKEKYSIEFTNLKDAKPCFSSNEKFEYGTNVTLNPPTDIKEGYEFAGYELNGETISNVVNISSDLEITVKWNLIHYTLTFVDEKLRQTFSPISFTVEDTVELPSPEENDYYKFNGWYLEDDENKTLLNNKAAFSAGDKTLIPSIDGTISTIRIFDKEGANPTSYQIEYGGSLELPAPQEYEHYTFLGYKDIHGDDALIYLDGKITNYPGKDDLDLIPVYKGNDYKITIRTNNPDKPDFVYDTSYPNTYKDIYDIIDNTENYVFMGLYYDSGLTKEIERTDVVDSDREIFADYRLIYKISQFGDFETMVSHPEYCYILQQDINCMGQQLPRVDVFTGIFDGGNHSIFNFVFNIADTGNVCGIINTNNGEIRNVSFKNFATALTYPNNNSATRSVGFLTGINSGTIDNVTIDEMTMSLSLRSHYSEKFYIGTIAGLNEGTIRNISISNSSISHSGNNTNSPSYSSKPNVERSVGILVGLDKHYVDNIRIDSTELVFSYTATPNGSSYARLNACIGSIGSSNGGHIKTIGITDTKVVFNESRKAVVDLDIGIALGKIINNAIVEQVSVRESKLTVPWTNYARVGAVIGQIGAGTSISDSYSQEVELTTNSTVEQRYIGGFAGLVYGSIVSCYSEIMLETNEKGYVGGFVGHSTSSAVIYKSVAYSRIIATNGVATGFAAKNDGSISNSYFVSDVPIYLDGDLINNKTDSNATPISKHDVYENSLFKTLYWDMEGWIISLDSFPFLSFEFSLESAKEYVETPTCERSGFTLVYDANSGKYFTKDAIPPTGHDFKYVETVEANCYHPGYILERCSVCGEEKHTDEKPQLQHVPVESSIEILENPTCEKDGSRTYTCNLCGSTVKETLEKHGHDAEVYDEIPSTCESEGTLYYHCKNEDCDETDGNYTASIPTHTDVDSDMICDVCGNYTGNGDPLSSFIKISTYDDLKNIESDMSGNYILSSDIDFSGKPFKPIGNKDHPFEGFLYGNNKTIKNISVNNDNVEDINALFYENRGKITCLNISNITINLNNRSAAFGGICYINKGTVSKCELKGKVNIDVTQDQTTTKLNDEFYVNFKAGGLVCENSSESALEASGRIINSNNSSISNITVTNNIIALGKLTLKDILDNFKKGTVTSNVKFYYSPIAYQNSSEINNVRTSGSIGCKVTTLDWLSRLMGKLVVNTDIYVGSLSTINTGTISNSTGTKISMTIYFLNPDTSALQEEITNLFYSKHNVTIHKDEYYTDLVAESSGLIIGCSITE